jgi:hypothetical protein
MLSAEKELAGFLKKFLPDVVKQAKAIRSKLQALLPGATEMVYDNWNGLVIGFGATERPSEAFLSMLIVPRWVTLCFLQGAKLSDPKKLMKGSGNIVRSMRLESPADIDKPEIRALIAQAAKLSPKPLGAPGEARLIIKSISPKQRPRRPVEKKN